MAEEARSYFELWLNEKVDSRRKRVQMECVALDRKAMAQKWYYDGRRVALTANIISDIYLPLIDRILDKAMEYEPRPQRVEMATLSLTKLLEEFSGLAVQAAKSTLMGKQPVAFEQSRTYSATIELIEPLRRRLLVKIEGARLTATKSPAEQQADMSGRDTVSQVQALPLPSKLEAYERALSACYTKAPHRATKDVCAKVWQYLEGHQLPRSPQEDSEAHRSMVRKAISRAVS